MELQIEVISKSFTEPGGKTRKVIDGFSAKFPKGSFALLRGASGAGKSTLLNMIAGLILPDSGEVIAGGEKINRLSEAERDRFRSKTIGYIFQTFNLLSPLTVIENLYVPAVLAGYGKSDDREKAMKILEAFSLADHADKFPYQLSVGQRQRVAIARAALTRPQIMLADEPTANLDADSAQAVINTLLTLRSEGTTLIVATHDPVFKEASPDQTILLEGKGGSK